MPNNSDGSITINTELDNSGFEKGSDKLLSAIENLSAQINNLGNEMRQAFSGDGASFSNMESAAQRAGSAADTQAQKVKQAASSMSQAYNQAAQDSGKATQGATNYDRELAKLQKQIDATKQKLAGYYQELAQIEKSTDEMLAQSYTDEQARNTLEIEEQQIAKVKEKYASLIKELEQLEGQYKKVAAAKNQSMQDADAAASTQAAQAQKKDAATKAEATRKTKEYSSASSGLADVLKRVAGAVANVAGKIRQMGFKALSTAIGRATSRLGMFHRQSNQTGITVDAIAKKLRSVQQLMITRIKHMFISALFANLQQGIASLQRFSSEFNNAMNSIKGSSAQLSGNIAVAFANIVNTIEPIVTRIINAVSTAVAWLNQFFALLRGKTTYTRATKAVDSYAAGTGDAAEAQQELNAELYSFDELNKQQKNSSGGGGGGGGGADAGGIEYEEVPIDLPEGVKNWVKRLKEAWKKEDWEGVGKVLADGITKAFEKVDKWINTKFRPIGVKWAERIARVLNGLFGEKKMWRTIGKTVADGFNAVFDIANTWLKTRKYKEMGAGIGAGIKAWFDNIEWDLIGETFARGWNALFHIIEGIVTTPGLWTSIGSSIGEMIHSFVKHIDINSVATSIISILNGITTSINAFLAEKPFEGLAEKIYTAINRILHEVDWAALGKALSDLFMTVLNTLWEIVQNVDWFSLGKAIGDFLGSIDWWGIISTVGQIIWTAFSGVLQGLLSTDGGRIFVALFAAVQGLKWAFLNNAGPLSKAATSMVGSVETSMTAAFGKLKNGVQTAAMLAVDAVLVAYDVGKLAEAQHTYSTAMGTHVKEIETALNSYKTLYTDKGKEVADEWAKMVYNIDTTGMSMDQAQQAIVDKVDSYWDGVPQSMWEGFQQGWNSYFGEGGSGFLGLVGDGIGGLITGIADMLGIHSPSTVFAGFGQNIVEGLKQGISQNWTSITSFFSSALPKLKEMFKGDWTGIANAAKTAMTGMKTSVTSTFNATKGQLTSTAGQLKSSLSSAWGSMKTTAQTNWNTMKSNITSTFNATKSNVGATATQIKSTMSSNWTSIRTNTQTNWNTMKTNITSTFNATKSNINSTAGQIKSNLSSSWNSVRSNTRTEWNAANTSIKDAMSKSNTAVSTSSSTIKSTISGAWREVNSNTSTAWTDIKDAASQGVTTMSEDVKGKMDGLTGHLNGISWSSIGSNLVSGLSSGIGGAWGGLMSHVMGLANSLIAGVKSTFGVHSPSTVFKAIGEFLDAGLVNGIERGRNGVITTAKNIAGAVTTAMTPEAAQLEVSDNLRLVISRLSEVAAMFRTIADALATMGGFSMPQIAAGTVAPYKTRIDREDAAETDNGGIIGYLIDILTELQRQGSQAQLSNRSGNTMIMIDGREIFQVIVNENNRAIKRTGASPIRV